MYYARLCTWIYCHLIITHVCAFLFKKQNHSIDGKSEGEGEGEGDDYGIKEDTCNEVGKEIISDDDMLVSEMANACLWTYTVHLLLFWYNKLVSVTRN